MSEWKPIETAPKDGTIIRVRIGRWMPYHVLWKDGNWRPIEYNGSYHPTHWQPIEPPK